MFERFTDRARRVVVLAQEEARLLGHNYIGTEHVLLGLIHEDEGVAAQALDSLGVSLGAVRAQVEEIVGPGETVPAGHIPFTPRSKKVLELSLRESLALGHNYIGTEHLLLGLVREGEGVGAQVLKRLGVELTRVRQRVVELLSGHDPAEGGRGAASPGSGVGANAALTDAILDALVAALHDHPEVLIESLSRAVQVAHRNRDTARLALLAQLVDIGDPETGEVRLRPRP